MSNLTAYITTIEGDGDQRPQIIASQTITIVLAILAVILRFVSRSISRANFSFNDWIIIPGLVCGLAVYGLFWWMLTQGLGRYEGVVTLGKLWNCLLAVWVGQMLYMFAVSFANFSVLALYWKIFRRKDARIYCAIVGILRFAWLATAVILACLQCQPIQASWDLAPWPPTCSLSRLKIFLATGSANIVLDFITIVPAIFFCIRLQLPRLDRFLLCCVFASGFLVTIIGGIKIKAVLDLDWSAMGVWNSTWTWTTPSIWFGVELNVAIISACLPCLRPLISKVASICSSSTRRQRSPSEADSASYRPIQPRRRTSGPGIGGVPGAWFRVSRMSQFGLYNDVEFRDARHPQSVHTLAQTQLGPSEVDLPIQDLHGDELPRMPGAAYMGERPPSWAVGLPLWDGASGRHLTKVEVGTPMSEIHDGILVRRSVDVESDCESHWPLKY